LKGNTEVSWLNGASDLTSVIRGFYSGGSAIQRQDWGSLGASAGIIVGKGLIYASKQSATLAKTLGSEAVKKALPTPTAIVDAAGIAIFLVDFLNGFGTPNAGAAVSTASDKLDLFMKGLDPGCVPDARDWSGTAASAYIAQNALLKKYAKDMKDLDAKLKTHLKSQADEITRAHMNIAVNQAVLTAAAGVALALYLIPIVGPEVSIGWQILAAFACCAAVLVIEMLTLANSMSLSHDLSALGQQYVTLGKDVEKNLAGHFGKIEGKVATQTSSRLSTFKDISGGLSSFSAPPTISALAATAGDKVSPAQKAVLDASSEREAAAAKSSASAKAEKTPAPAPAAPAAPAPAAAATPATAVPVTVPSLAQIAQMSGQVSKVSQNVSQPVNQAVGQVQQFAQMGQQGQQGGQGPAAPAADDAAEKAPAEDTAGAGAASGKEGTERAPIDAAKSGAEGAGAGRERVL
jgi:EspA/EspE family